MTMAEIVFKPDDCEGCGECIDSCPYGYIEIVNDKAVIKQECNACGACIEECPSEAINEGDEFHEIDPEKCTSCGTCVDACPNQAIVEVEEQ